MLSRATDLDGLLIMRLPQRSDLVTGAPAYLVEEMDSLRRLERASLTRLRGHIKLLHGTLAPETLEVIEELFLSDDLSHRDYGQDLCTGPSLAAATELSTVTASISSLRDPPHRGPGDGC